MTSEKQNTESSPLNTLDAKGNAVVAGISIGSIVDEKYELIEVVGRGAHGVVYKARHRMLDQYVAIKFYDPQLFASEHSVERFQKEACLLSAFEHQNIVKFQSYGKTPDGQHYMVLEFLAGETLESIIAKTGPLDEARILPIFIQVCRGLKYVHEGAVLHRDLKPSNIMVQAEADGDHVRIMDFGVFKDLSTANQQLTKTGALVGSANYMSPEQCKSEALSQASDIYALGCVMYEAFVGVAPMNTESELLIMSNQLSKEISAVPARRGISKQTEGIILRCLNKSPDNRFTNAADLQTALEQAIHSPLVLRSSFSINPTLLFLSLPIAVLAAFFLFAWLSPHYSAPVTDPEILANVKKQKQLAVPEVEPDDLLQSYQKMLNWLNASSGEYFRSLKRGNKRGIHREVVKGHEPLNDPNDAERVAAVLLSADMLREQLGISSPNETLDSAEKYLSYHLHFQKADIRADNPRQLRLQRFCIPHYLAKDDLNMVENILASLKGSADEETTTKEQANLLGMVVGVEERRAILCETYVRMSEVELYRGHFSKARDLLQSAYEIPRLPNDLAAECLVKLASIAELLNDEDKCRTYLLRTANSPLWREGRLSSGVAVGMLHCMNDMGMSEEVIECTSKHQPDSKDDWIEALLQKEIARAYVAKGNFPEARKFLERALKSCTGENQVSKSREVVELAYLRVLHDQHNDEMMKNEGHKYLDSLKSGDSKEKYLMVMARVMGLFAELGVNSRADWQRIDQELESYEKEGNAPVESIIGLRLVAASAARSRKDLAAELGCYDRASHQILESTSLKMNCLRLTVDAKRMEALSKAAQPDYARIEEIYESSQKHYGDAAAPFVFLNRDIFLRAMFNNSNNGKAQSHSLAERKSMLDSKEYESIAVSLEDYADCAINLASDYARINQKEEAYYVLSKCHSLLTKCRPTQFDEIASVCLSARDLAPTAALKEEWQNRLSQARAKAQLQDPNDISWEPYRLWTR